MSQLMTRMSSVRCLPAVALALLFCPMACGGRGPNTSPSPVVTPPGPPGGVVLGPASGPTRITFMGADPAPGTNVGGCGPSTAGCRHRVRIRLELQASNGGPVLYVRLFLHSQTQQACLIGQTGPL